MSYTRNLMEINLTEHSSQIRHVEDELIQLYLGGRGFGTRLIFDYLKTGVEPLSEENIIFVLTGPLTGTPAPCMRLTLVTKSPATNTFCASYIGGHIGAEIKTAGYDGIIIIGKSEKPVYLDIVNDKVKIKDAAGLWGKDTFETETCIKEKDPRCRVLCIGPAGENLVKYALVNTEYYRHAGRGGIGAVFGSKNLKAIAVRGTKGVKLARPEKFVNLAKSAWHDLQSETTYRYGRWGTLGSVLSSSDTSTFPYKNYQEETFPEAYKISGELADKTLYVKKRACFGCPIHCGHLSSVRNGFFKGTLVEGPEYETAAMLGGNCAVNDLYGLSYLNMLCDKLGIDTISAGGVLAFVMECYEKGIISKQELNGLDLKWGNINAMAELLRYISVREGIGDILAEGTKFAAVKLGGNASDYAMHVKGLEIPGWTVRSVPGMGLCYATADRGADHQQANTCSYEISGAKGPDGVAVTRYSPVGKAHFVKTEQDYIASFSCMISCEFAVASIGIHRLLQLYEYATDIELDEKAYLEVGERSFNMTRMFNARDGFSRNEDTLPERFFSGTLSTGIAKGQVLEKKDFSYMLDDYYQLRGWDKKMGIPKNETLQRLGIDQFAFR